MKVLFLNPPNIDSQYINRDLMGGLGVNVHAREKFSEKIMAFLKARSIRLPVMSMVYSLSEMAKYHDVVAVDAANLDLSREETLAAVRRAKPDWVISTTSIAALMQEAELLGDIKREFGVTVGLMGDSATNLFKRVLDSQPIDFIIRGDEPEHVIAEIAKKGDYRGVQGVIYRDGTSGSGSIIESGDPGMIPDLNALSFPRWEYFPIHTYRYFPILRSTPFLTMLSTRGCPYGCIYCPYTSNQGLKYRFRSAQNVLDELVYIKSHFNVKAVQFRDPTFTLKKDRTVEICDGMIANHLNLEWGCETRVDCLDEALIEKMAEAGLRGVNIGIESSDPQVIRNAKRGWIDPNHIRKMVKRMSELGIRVSGFFIIGLPGENRDTVRQTIDFAVELPLSYAEFKIATPFPGTPLFEMAKANKWIEEVNLEQYTSYTPSMKIPGDLDPDFLKHTANTAYRSFYMRPRKIFGEIFSDSFISGMTGALIGNHH